MEIMHGASEVPQFTLLVNIFVVVNIFAPQVPHHLFTSSGAFVPIWGE